MHPFAKIKTVRPLPLHPGVERQRLAAKCNGFFFKPVKHHLTSTLRTERLIADQIINIQAAPFVRVFKQTPQRKATHGTAINDQRHARAIGEYGTHSSRIVVRQLRPELPMHGFGSRQPHRLAHRATGIGYDNNMHF